MLSDYLTRPGIHDRARIDVNEPEEVSYWIEALAVTEKELRVAVAEVGMDVDEVSSILGRSA